MMNSYYEIGHLTVQVSQYYYLPILNNFCLLVFKQHSYFCFILLQMTNKGFSIIHNDHPIYSFQKTQITFCPCGFEISFYLIFLIPSHWYHLNYQLSHFYLMVVIYCLVLVITNRLFVYERENHQKQCSFFDQTNHCCYQNQK